MFARNTAILTHIQFSRRLLATGSRTDRKSRSTVTISHQNEITKVVVAMSGGVDSSVAAYILQNLSDATVKVSGLHMSNWNALDEDSDDANRAEPNRRCASSSNKDKRHSAQTKQPRQSRTSNSAFCEASEKEYNDSQSVCQHLSIPLHRVSFASEYWIQVFEPFVERLSSPTSLSSDDNSMATRGEFTMPNPDFSCNTHIKFGAMKNYAINKLSADFVATGHYAQLWHRGYDFSSKRMHQTGSKFFEWMEDIATKLEDEVNEAVAGRPEAEWLLSSSTQPQTNSHRPMLLAGDDRTKDQTYFLSGVKTDNFRHMIFPLGNLVKRQSSDEMHRANRRQSVRDIAVQAKLPTASKKDSMGICFIGKRNFGQFVSQYVTETPQPGPFVDIDTGEIVGGHQGSMHYTIGQGAKISGANAKYFVCGKGANGTDDANTIFVCNDTHHPSLYTDELFVAFNEFNWIGLGKSCNDNISFSAPMPLLEGSSIEVLARTRHLQPLVPCSVSWQRHLDGSCGNLCVKLHTPMRAVTPGQILALYAGQDGLICLGGGPILSRGQSLMERGLCASKLHPSGHNDLSLRRFESATEMA